MHSLEAAVAADQDYLDALLGLSALQLETGRAADAVKLLEHAVKIAPREVNAHFNLGYAFSQVREFVRAASEWETALTIDPTHVDSLDNLLLVYITLQDFDKAFGVVKRFTALGRAPEASSLELLLSASGRTE